MNYPFKWRGFCLHPNGFYLTLLGSIRGCRIRIHYWPPETEKLDTPHDHRSWFVSIPLWGLLEERRFEAIEGDGLEIHRCSATTAGNGKPITRKVGLGDVRQTRRTMRFPFIPYLCPVDAIHSLVPKTRRALTLVVFGPNKKAPKAWLKKETITR